MITSYHQTDSTSTSSSPPPPNGGASVQSSTEYELSTGRYDDLLVHLSNEFYCGVPFRVIKCLLEEPYCWRLCLVEACKLCNRFDILMYCRAKV